MTRNKLNYKLINITALMLLLYIGLSNINLWIAILTKILSVLAPFIIGFIFAYALYPIVKLLEKKGVRKSISVTTVVMSLVLIVGLLAVLTLPNLYDQASNFAKSLLEIVSNFGNKFHVNLGNFEIKLTDFLNDAVKDIGTIASSTTIDIISKSIDFLGKFIVGFVGFIYFLADMDQIRVGFKNILLSINKKSYNYVKCLDEEIGNYLKGLGIFMIIQFFEYSILYFLVGHPNWLILGILACITTIIPYFGGLATNILAIITASLISPKVLIGTIIICLIFPQLDGYLISPKVYGKTNNVNPLITIMAVSVGGTLAGIPGIIAALPCYLLCRTTCLFFKQDLKNSMKKIKSSN